AMQQYMTGKTQPVFKKIIKQVLMHLGVFQSSFLKICDQAMYFVGRRGKTKRSRISHHAGIDTLCDVLVDLISIARINDEIIDHFTSGTFTGITDTIIERSFIGFLVMIDKYFYAFDFFQSACHRFSAMKDVEVKAKQPFRSIQGFICLFLVKVKIEY